MHIQPARVQSPDRDMLRPPGVAGIGGGTLWGSDDDGRRKNMRAVWWMCAALAGAAWGCDRPRDAAAPGETPPAVTDPPTAADGPLRGLADALQKAPSVSALHRDFIERLPAPADSERAALVATAADGAVPPFTRLAARAALGALADASRVLALRTWLNEAVALPARNERRTSMLAVRLMTTLFDPLVAARRALPADVARLLPPTSPGERTAWQGGMAERPLTPPTADDIPALTRMALSHQAASPRLAWLWLAALDDPAATEALLWLPSADLGEPRPGPGLSGWALALHATLPGARTRLRAALKSEGRGADRAAVTLAWLGDPAASAPLAALLDRLGGQAGEAENSDFDLATLIEGAGLLVKDAGEDDPLAQALARYGETGQRMSARAGRLAGKAGIAADRDKLFDRVTADPSDPRARRALLRLLRAGDGPRLAKLLARDRWGLAGFFHHVRMVDQAPKAVLDPTLVAALEAVAAEHPAEQTREWALGALADAAGPIPAVVRTAAAKGSKAGVRTLVMRADDPWAELASRMTGDDDAVRRAAYEMLIAPRLLPFEPTAAQAAAVLDHVAGHMTARPEEPWVFLRAARHYVELAKPELTPARQKALARALRPYCVTSGPDDKPWWDALFTVGSLDHAEARAVIADAVKSVPTAGGRAVMRERLGLPPDPNDAPATPPPAPAKRGGHWADPSKAGGHR